MIAAARLPAERHEAIVRAVLDEAKRRFVAATPPAHRALGNARVKREMWLMIRRLAKKAVGRLLQESSS